MKKNIFILILSFSLFKGNAQDTIQPLRVGIFAPLYLDSAFTGSMISTDENMPRYFLPGLEFIEGAKMALDTLNLKSRKIKVVIYDTKSKLNSISSLQYEKVFDSLNLIIASVNATELKNLALVCFQKNIPLISATLPNDAGITKNPFLVIAYATFNTHINALFSYIQKNFVRAKIIIATKKGTVENRIEQQFETIRSKANATNFKWQAIPFADTVSADILKLYLDTSKQNVIIGTSLDENFAKSLVAKCAALKSLYKITLIGMPTWDGIRDFNVKKEYRDFPLYYSSSFYNEGYDSRSMRLKTIYNNLTAGNASEMVYKGYETVYYFINLLAQYKDQLLSNLNQPSFKLFSDYDFKPVVFSSTVTPDYFENKKVYILKKENGIVSKVY